MTKSKNKKDSHKIQLHQDLGDKDFDRRVQFRVTKTGMIVRNRNILRNKVAFS